MIKRTLSYYFILVFILIVFISIFIFLMFRTLYINEVKEKLIAISEIVDFSIDDIDVNEYDKTIKKIANNSSQDIRITLVNNVGNVLGETNTSFQDMENHLSRPEIQEALHEKIGTNIRYSETIKLEYFYLANYFKDKGIYIRISIPLSQLDEINKTIMIFILIFIIFSLLLSVFLVFIFERGNIKPVNDLIRASKEITHGDYSKRLVPKRDDEIGQLAKSFNTMASKLEVMDEVRRNFVSNVTHELKTPLTSIKGFIETLKNGAINDPEIAEKFLDIIEIESDRLTMLINDILYLSEIERKRPEEYLEVLDLKDIVKSVISLLETQTKAQNVTLICDDHNLKFKANKNRMKQLLINLVDNGIKYNKKGGHVYIRYENHDEFIKIIVKDTGIGMEEKHLSRIFERFYRVDKGRSREMGGTGLGLSIVKHLVNLFSGEITVKSAIGKGTEFIIKLPK